MSRRRELSTLTGVTWSCESIPRSVATVPLVDAGHHTDDLVEDTDVIIVGARLAGSAAAIALRRLGRRVVVVDRSRLPANTLSTHGFWPSAVSELSRLGALERVLDDGPPKVHTLLIHHMGRTLRKPFNPVDGFSYGLSVPRTHLDAAVLATAVEAGADVRLQHRVTDLLRKDGRVVGVRCESPDGRVTQLRGRFVVGADGRRSTVADLVGAAVPYRGSRNDRGFVYWYMDDPKVGTEWRHTGALWRVGDTVVLVGPMAQDRLSVVCMPPVEHVRRFRADPGEMWERLLREHRHLADRVRGATRPTRMFSVTELPAFFRASTGPGWALAGDAGHFKDPSVAQGIREALRHSRMLGEIVGTHLEDVAGLDGALMRWEHLRDQDCLGTYHWANRESGVDSVQPILSEAIRAFSTTGGGLEFGDVLSRLRSLDEVTPPSRAVVWLARAMTRPHADRRLILRQAAAEAALARDSVREARDDRFRTTVAHASERPGWQWPPRRDEVGPAELEQAVA